MNNPKPVFLVGFMGSGKTTWGKQLAQKTGRVFIDLDDAIVERAGLSIPAYFSTHGEPAFRELEHTVLKQLPLHQPAVVATGGGTPCFYDNMDWMNRTGVTIYFHLPPKALWHRLMQTDITARPALQGQQGEALLADITSRLAQRMPYYQQAHHVINQLHASLDDVLALIR